LGFSTASLVKLIGVETQKLLDMNRVAEAEIPYRQQKDELSDWEDHIKSELEADTEIPETERKALVKSRVGQGRFKLNVAQIERQCRITKVDRIEHLRASHLKPWRDSSNSERLDGENGLRLTPTIDHLFDRGFISFEDNGLLIISPVAHTPSLEKMGVPVSEKLNVGAFIEGQKQYLDFHRENVFLEKR
jgi:putative restriction endonuclease